MDALQSATVQCPYCWESISFEVDCSIADQEYTEDCAVCCQPIVVAVHVDTQGHIDIDAKRESD